MEENNSITRDFKGVWIPKEIWLDTRLSALDKIILTEIDSLDNDENGCFASNEYIAKFCQCSPTKVSNSISKLLQFNYLYVKKFDGRVRYLKSRLTKSVEQTYKKCKADLQKMQDINIYNNIDNNKEINKESSSLPEPYEDLVDHFEEIWSEYPNKKGKNKAFKHYFTWIKGKEYCGKKVKLTARQMWYAVQNYLEEINLKGTQPQYIKHGDTFFNNIIDYVKEEDDS